MIIAYKQLKKLKVKSTPLAFYLYKIVQLSRQKFFLIQNLNRINHK